MTHTLSCRVCQGPRRGRTVLYGAGLWRMRRHIDATAHCNTSLILRTPPALACHVGTVVMAGRPEAGHICADVRARAYSCFTGTAVSSSLDEEVASVLLLVVKPLSLDTSRGAHSSLPILAKREYLKPVSKGVDRA